MKRISSIKKAGLLPVIKVIAKDLTENEAFLIEKTLIWKLGNTLTNISSGHFANKFRPHNTMHLDLSGFDFKNEVVNLYKKARKPIMIDFKDVGIISSSYADEFIGKLVVELGFVQFQTIFTLVNMNKTIQTIVQRSLSQRMAESIS